MARGLERSLEVIVVALMIALTAIVIAGVGFRKAGAALVWYDEVAPILLAWLTYYGASLAALHRVHIGFPRLVERSRPERRRVLVVVREVVVIGFFSIAAWSGVRVVTVLAGTSLVSLPWVSAQIAQSVIPIGAVLFIVAEVAGLPEVWRSTRSTDGDASRSRAALSRLRHQRVLAECRLPGCCAASKVA